MRPEIEIQAEDFDLTVRLGEGAARPTAGFGGHEEVARPDDVAITEWVGTGTIHLSVPILLDGLAQDRSVQPQLDKLLSLGRADDDDEPPSPFRVTGPIPYSGRRFVIETTPEFGDSIRREDGALIRQPLTLTLMEYVRPDRIRFRKKKKRRKRRRTYKVKDGENLNKIARKLYGRDGARKKAKAIGRLNDIRDPRRKLKRGRELRLP